MSELKKLSDAELEAIRGSANEEYMTTLPQVDRIRLLGHIDAMQAEFDALVKSSDELIDEQAKRIEALENTVRFVIYGVRDIDAPCEKWVCGKLSSVLPGFEHIESGNDRQKANG